jgi:hypothetical protein
VKAPLAEVQRAMVREIASPDGDGIYRSLVRRSLADMLRFELPRTAAHLGARWDRDVARFLDVTLPRSRYLRDIAAELVAHVRPAWEQDPDAPPYIVDLARWELLAFEVANAPDDPPAGPPAPPALDRRVTFSSSTRLFRAAFAVHLLPEDEPFAGPPAAQPTALCVYRDADFEMRTLSLTPSAVEILERLAAGADLGGAVSGAAAARGAALDAAFLQGAARLLEDLTERGVVRGFM